MGRTKSVPLRRENRGRNSTCVLASPSLLRQKAHQLQDAAAEAQTKNLDDSLLENSSSDYDKDSSDKIFTAAAQKRRKLEALSKRNAERGRAQTLGTSLDSLFASAFNSSKMINTTPTNEELYQKGKSSKKIANDKRQATFQDSDADDGDNDRKLSAGKAPPKVTPTKRRRIIDDDID